MRLLISAYACAPHKGSEHAVGWNWVTAAHRLGHRVVALASPVHRVAILNACARDVTLGGIEWVFPEVPGWNLRQDREPVWERSYNLLWQMVALRAARALCSTIQFDVIHHVTWGGVRAPTFLGSLGPKLVLGPLGGGETSPLALRRGLRFRAKVSESLRDLSNRWIIWNPIVRGGLTKAAVIFTRTPETRAMLPLDLQHWAMVFSELSLEATQIGRPHAEHSQPARLLYVGRLLYWKGLDITVEAFARIASRLPGTHLTIVGSGPEAARLKARVAALGLEGDITFLAWVPREAVTELYDSHDILLFPSLHDSGGTVVLEALSRGVPVVCLDLGGPAQMVTPQSGIVVPTAGRDVDQVAACMSMRVVAVLSARRELAAMSAAAIGIAARYILDDRISAFYTRVSALLNTKSGRSDFTVGQKCDAGSRETEPTSAAAGASSIANHLASTTATHQLYKNGGAAC